MAAADETDDFDSFWNRFSSKPDFNGKRVLEIGCGNGALSVSIAQSGAESVVGVDIVPKFVEQAKARVERHFPELAARTTFTTRPLAELEDPPFDLVVSKDSFEHIIDVSTMLRALRRCVHEAARLYIGFSPLYHSPYGDHDRRQTAFRHLGVRGRLLAMLPWGHLFLENQIIRRHRVIQSRPITSMHDLNLNMMTIGDFRRYVDDAGFRPEYFAVNQGGNPLGWPFSVLRHLPWLETYCTYNVYCELGVASQSSAERT